MYLFLENNLMIPTKNILLIIDYIHIQSSENIEFFQNELKHKELVELTLKDKKSVVLTDRKVYVTSYGTQTLFSRCNEFFNIIGGRK